MGIGHEHVLEDDHRLLAAKARVPGVDVRVFERAPIAALAAIDVGDARVIDRDRGAHRVVAIGFYEPHRRHHQQPVRVDAAGLMQLCAAHHHAVGASLDDSQEHVFLLLLVRGLAAIALGIRHRAADHEVLSLHVLHEFVEALVIVAARRAIDIEGHRIQGVDRVHPDAALEAGAGALPEPTLHAVLEHHVVHVLGHLQEAVDALPGQLRLRRRKLGVFLGQRVGLRDRVDRGPDHRVVDRLLDQVAKQIDAQLAAAEALDIFGSGADGHKRWVACAPLVRAATPANPVRCGRSRIVRSS